MADYSDSEVMAQYDRNRAALRPKEGHCVTCGCRYLALERQPAEMDHSEVLCLFCITWVDMMAANRNMAHRMMAFVTPTERAH